MIDRSLLATFIIGFLVILFILDIATRGKYVTRKTRVVFLIVGVLLGFIYVSFGTDGAPSLMFDVITFLTMAYLFVWGIRKRMAEKRPENSSPPSQT